MPQTPLTLSKGEAKKLYGLTERDFQSIGPPDLIQTRSGYGVRYHYRLERLEAWVRAHQAELTQSAERRARRRETATSAVQTRRAETLRWVERVPIEIPAPLPNDLELQVREYYGMPQIKEEELIEFVRWRFSNYPMLLKGLAGRTGAKEARYRLLERVDDAIRRALGRSIG